MAVLLYTNGITEDYVPQSHVFTERELVNLFNEFEYIKTKRLITVVNCWCIWGVNKKYDLMDLNRIVSDINQEAVYSHALFVHDSEINPEWNASDNVLYSSYPDFLMEIKKLIDISANNIINEFQSYGVDDSRVMPILETVGSTQDKRVLFSFDPTEQNSEFYENEQFLLFSKRAYEYIKNHEQKVEPFTIFADKKAIIIVDTPKVALFIEKMLDKFKKEEQYEICKELTTIIDKWDKTIESKKSILPPTDI